MLNERLVEANRLVNQHLLRNETEIMEYNWQQFVYPILESNNVKVVPFRFNGVASELQAGSLVIRNSKAKIFYNSTMIKSRINFTICHETGHFIFDTNYGETPEYLASSWLGEYDDDEVFNEKLTDATAGVIMCPDIVILKYMETDLSFIRMAENLKMSKSALYVRLIQFIYTKIGCKESHAVELVNKFRYTNDRYFIYSRLASWGSTKKKDIIYDYENCL